MGQGSGFSGMGAIFRRWDALNSLWVEIAEIKKIGWSGMSRKTFDTTTLSTPGGYETFGLSLRAAGSLKLDMNFTRAVFTVMKADFDSDVIQNYELILPDSEHTSFEFEGAVTECPFDVPQDQVTLSVTIKINGAPTIEFIGEL